MDSTSGNIIGGRYELTREIGCGCVSVVYEALDRHTNREVALKIAHSDLTNDNQFYDRLRTAFKLGKKLRHPNIARSLEFIDDGWTLGYSMELAKVGNLSGIISLEQSLPLGEIVTILCQICSGLQYLHDSDLTHRNIKPENILFFEDGAVKIANFMLACQREGRRSVEETKIFGSIEYVTPEYMLKGQVDWRTDIYGLGLLAYELVTGRYPFTADSVHATMVQRLRSDPAPPSSLRSDCPLELDQVILRALHRDPSQRFQSASEIAHELGRLKYRVDHW